MDWHEVGSRDGATILAAYAFMGGVGLFEESADGSLTWIASPFPTDSEQARDFLLDGAVKNTTQCYETLAIPSSVPLVDGAIGKVMRESFSVGSVGFAGGCRATAGSDWRLDSLPHLILALDHPD